MKSCGLEKMYVSSFKKNVFNIKILIIMNINKYFISIYRINIFCPLDIFFSVLIKNNLSFIEKTFSYL